MEISSHIFGKVDETTGRRQIDEELFDAISGFEALAAPRQQPGQK
jgi:hypothetical protein